MDWSSATYQLTNCHGISVRFLVFFSAEEMSGGGGEEIGVIFLSGSCL